MRLEDIDFNALLPHWMQNDPSNVGLSAGLSAAIILRNAAVKSASVFDCLNTLPDYLLDNLAKILEIGWYQNGWGRTQKIECLAAADEIRTKNGTKYALEKALQLWLNDPTAEVQEWFSYGGPYYSFRILTQSNAAATLESKESFNRLLAEVKRASQDCDGIFIGFSLKAPTHVGAVGGNGQGSEGQAKFLIYAEGWSGVDSVPGLIDYMLALNPNVPQNVIEDYLDTYYDEGNEEFQGDTPLSINMDQTPRVLGWADQEALENAYDLIEGVGFSSPLLIAYSWPVNSLNFNLQNFWTFYSPQYDTYTEAPYFGTGACSTSQMNHTMHGEYYCSLYPAADSAYCRVSNAQCVGNNVFAEISFDVNFTDDYPDAGKYACLGMVGRCTMSTLNTNRYLYLAIDEDGFLRLMYYYSGTYYTIGQSTQQFPQNQWVNIQFRCQNGFVAVYVDGETFFAVLAADSDIGAKSSLSYISVGNALSGTSSQVGSNTYTPAAYWTRFGYWIGTNFVNTSTNSRALAAKMDPWNFLPKP